MGVNTQEEHLDKEKSVVMMKPCQNSTFQEKCVNDNLIAKAGSLSKLTRREEVFVIRIQR